MAETQARQISCSSQHKVKILPGAGEGDERERGSYIRDSWPYLRGLNLPTALADALTLQGLS